ncbi:hypothetical protein F2Q69_00020852, partial [Brassica cretica]
DISTTHEANRWCARTFSFHKPCLPMMKKKQKVTCSKVTLMTTMTDHKNGDEHALASSPQPLSLNWNQPWVHILLPQALMCRLRLDEETGYCCDSLMQLFWTADLVLP